MRTAFSNNNGNGSIWSAKSAGCSWRVSWWEEVCWPWLPVNNDKLLIRCVQPELGTWLEVLRFRVNVQKSWDKEGCRGPGGSRKRGHGGQAEVSAHQMTCPLLTLPGREQNFRWALWPSRGKGMLFLWCGWQVGILLDVSCFVNNVTLILSESSLGWGWWGRIFSF